MAEKSTIKEQANSGAGSSITSLTRLQSDKAAAVARWNRLHWFLTTGVAVFGALTIISSFVINAKNEELSDVQTQLADEKDRVARKEADAIRVNVAEANERAAHAVAEAARFNEIAEREKLARLQLEERLAPRVITEADRVKVVDLLTPLTGSRVNVFFSSQRVDSVNLGNIIVELMKRSGWWWASWAITGGDVSTGVVVVVAEGASKDEVTRAEAIVNALNGCGIAAKLWPTPFEPKKIRGIINGPVWSDEYQANIRLFVGDKP